jgi:hypothetical protein
MTAINKLAVVVPQRAVPMLTTSGDISPDGTLMVLLTYFAAYWSVGVNGELHEFPVTEQKQDEAIAFTRDGKSVLVGSEGVHSAVYRIALPAEAIAADAAAGGTPTSRPTTTPVPTVKPTVQPTVTPSAKPTPTAPRSTQSSLPVTTSAPAPSALSSLESSALAPESSAQVSTLPGPSSNEQTPSTSASHSVGSWLPWVVLVVAVCAILLAVGRRLHWWPWGRR